MAAYCFIPSSLIHPPSSPDLFTLSLLDALPISGIKAPRPRPSPRFWVMSVVLPECVIHRRSEEHTSELQSRGHLVCRLLLEKKETSRLPPTFRPVKDYISSTNYFDDPTRSTVTT